MVMFATEHSKWAQVGLKTAKEVHIVFEIPKENFDGVTNKIKGKFRIWSSVSTAIAIVIPISFWKMDRKTSTEIQGIGSPKENDTHFLLGDNRVQGNAWQLEKVRWDTNPASCCVAMVEALAPQEPSLARIGRLQILISPLVSVRSKKVLEAGEKHKVTRACWPSCKVRAKQKAKSV